MSGSEVSGSGAGSRSAGSLTAPADGVPRRDPSVLTLADCWRDFVRRRTPPLLGLAIAGAIALRVVLGSWDWRDLVVAGGVLALTPLAEWAIHVYLLHARPISLAGHRHDLLAAREHRAHHAAPAALDGVLVPLYGMFIFLPLIALTVWALSFPIHLVLGGDRIAHAATGLLVSYCVLSAYEWCHFLIHTPYRPRALLPLDLARSPTAPLQERALLVRRHLNRRRPAPADRTGSGRRAEVEHGRHARRVAGRLRGPACADVTRETTLDAPRDAERDTTTGTTVRPAHGGPSVGTLSRFGATPHHASRPSGGVAAERRGRGRGRAAGCGRGRGGTGRRGAARPGARRRRAPGISRQYARALGIRAQGSPCGGGLRPDPLGTRHLAQYSDDSPAQREASSVDR